MADLQWTCGCAKIASICSTDRFKLMEKETIMKRTTKLAAVFSLVLMAAICFGSHSAVSAGTYVGSVSGIQQTDAQKTSVTVTWTPVENATGYQVECEDKETEKTVTLTTADTTADISGLQAATNYTVKVTPFNSTDTGSTKYLWDVVTLPDKMPGLAQDKWWFWIKKLDVSWNRQSAADGYEAVLYNDKGKVVQKKNLTYNSVTFSKMEQKVYTVKVRSYLTWNGKKYYSSWGKIYCLNQARITSAKIKGNRLNVKWGKVSGATGYNIYVSTKKNSGYKKVATVKSSKSSAVVKKFRGKKFSSGKRYYVYVETVCNKKGSKNTSGGLYCWNTDSSYTEYINN